MLDWLSHRLQALSLQAKLTLFAAALVLFAVSITGVVAWRLIATSRSRWPGRVWNRQPSSFKVGTRTCWRTRALRPRCCRRARRFSDRWWLKMPRRLDRWFRLSGAPAQATSSLWSMQTEIPSSPLSEVASVQSLLETRRQRVELHLPQPPPVVLADGCRIQQVLVNLLSNANKYGPEGDTIYIAAEEVDGQVQVRVTDHGPGIPRRSSRTCSKHTSAPPWRASLRLESALAWPLSKRSSKPMEGVRVWTAHPSAVRPCGSPCPWLVPRQASVPHSWKSGPQRLLPLDRQEKLHEREGPGRGRRRRSYWTSFRMSCATTSSTW